MGTMINLLNNFQSIKTKDIIEKLADYEYVSFDLFDTLIKRVVPNPTDIFEIVKIIAEERNLGSYPLFKQDRIIAERLAYKKSGNIEITLEDIYDNLTCYNDILCKKLMDIECEVEEICCVINKELQLIYNWCVENGKKILIVSDMYLSFKILKRILEKNSYISYEALFVSSDIGYKKHYAKLFKYILNEQNISAKDIIHIGDNFRSDYLCARWAGISSIKISKVNWRNEWLKPKVVKRIGSFEYGCLAQMINVMRDNDADDYYQFGYENFGMILYGFSKWLKAEIDNKGIKKVFFLARDGFIMKKAFEEFLSENNIESHYLYISRRSLRIPAMWINLEYERLVEHLTQCSLLSIENIIENWGLEINEYNNILTEFGFDSEELVKTSEIFDNEKLRNFFNYVKPRLIENSKKEYNLLINYFEQEGFFGDIAIVDIGWSGNIQKYITSIINEYTTETNIYGYYMGLSSNASEIKAKYSMNMKGYIYDNTLEEANNETEGTFSGWFEALFFSNEGSTEKYQYSKDGNVEPLLFDYEYDSKGALVNETQKIEQLQTGAIAFIRDLNMFAFFNKFKYNVKSLNYLMQKAINSPSKKTLSLFADFRYKDLEVLYMARPKRIAYYIFHPKQLWLDFLKSTWKAGFVKRLMKTNIIYPKLFYLIYNSFKNNK